MKENVKHNLEVEQIEVGKLKAYERNARTHSDKQIKQIAASVEEFGWTNPILIDEKDEIIAGHARARVAELLKLETVPAIRLAHLSPTQKRALILADNQLAISGAGWDENLLKLELADLRLDNFDVGLLGFSVKELNALHTMTGAGSDADAEVEPPAEPRSKLGDVWILGNHRIVCGDSTDPETVKKCLNGAEPHLMVTDPPYGVEYDAEWRNEAGLAGAGIATGKVLNDDEADWTKAWELFPGDAAYVWHASTKTHIVAESLISTGFLPRALIIWNKSSMVIGRGDYHHKHEPLWYMVRKGRPGHYVGDRKQTTVWDIDKPSRSETGHSTQKPVDCMLKPIQNNSVPGDAIYEPFSGSGTTIIACQMSDRHCRAVELNEAYVDLAVIRWAQFTGGTPILEATGQTWDEVGAERLGSKADSE